MLNRNSARQSDEYVMTELCKIAALAKKKMIVMQKDDEMCGRGNEE